MSTGSGTRTGSDLLPTITLGLLTAVVAFGFIRVFDSPSFLVPLGIVVVTGHLLAAWTRRLPTGAPTLIMLAAGTLVTIDVTHWSTVTAGLPTPFTFATISHSLDAAVETLRNGTAPVAPEAGLVFAAAIALWIVAWSTDRLTFTYGAPVEALVPTATVFVVVTSLGGPDHRWSCTALYGAALALHVLVVRQAAVVRPTGVRNSAVWRPVLRGSAMAAVALFVGLGAAATVPSLDTAGVVGLHDSHSITVVSPLVDIRSRLVDQTDDVLFTVDAAHGEYWRLMALGDFDGETWSPPDSRVPEADHVLSSPDFRPDYEQFQAAFDLSGLGGQFAPAPFRPTGLYALQDSSDPEGDPRLLWDANSSTLIASSATADVTDLSYVVTAQVPDVQAAQVRAARGPVPEDIERTFTRLPAGFPAVLREQAERIVAAAPTPYAKALALQDYFSPRNGFGYSTDLRTVPAGENTNAMIEFLRVRKGFCEQYAGTYAALARAVGLPTRIAVGFTWGREETASDGTKSFVVTGRNAHAWPEVYFAGLGWLPFEPTPGRGNPAATSYTGVAARQDDATPTAPDDPLPPTTAPGRIEPAPSTTAPRPATSTPTAVAPTVPDREPPSPGAARSVAERIVVVALGALVVCSGALVRVLRRCRRARLAVTPASRVRLVWAEVLHAWKPLDLVRRPVDTDRDVGRRLQARIESLVGPDGTEPGARRLAELATAAAWNSSGVTDADAREATAVAARVSSVARDHRTRWSRFLGWFDPRGPKSAD